MANCFEHPWLAGLFGDDEMAAIWSAQAQLQRMLAFEAAWSEAGHLAGLWTEDEGISAANAIRAATINPTDLKDGTAKDGVCVPALVAQLKAQTGLDQVHTGATSQDVIDTACVLCAVGTLDRIDARLAQLIDVLQALDTKFGSKPLQGRTRMQSAEMIKVADRINAWTVPLHTNRERLGELRPRISRIQMGGAAGDRKALGESHRILCEQVAASLGLQSTEKSWHTQRDAMAEFASLLSLIGGSLGKIGQDIVLMSQKGIDEIALSGGGSSSAMPHKNNPVMAELLITLARFNAVQLSGMHQALVHEQERSGAAWALEWMILPQMAQTTGRSLRAAIELVGSIEDMGTNMSAMT